MNKECQDRIDDPRMEYYRYVYQNSEMWTPDKGSLEGKTIIVYGEQGFGDQIQFARHIPTLKKHGCKVIFHCAKELHRLFECLGVELIDDVEEAPPHDYHVLSLSLPFVLNERRIAKFPYLTVDEKADLGDEDKKKIGICWEAGDNKDKRNCPLRYFRMLETPYTKLVMLQKEIKDPALIYQCGDMDLYGYEINDFYDTATVINALDMVVTVDTAVLHLAGSLNKLTYGIFNLKHDPRWDVECWYDSMVLVKLKTEDDWLAAFRTVIGMCTGLTKDAEKDFANDME
jgi:hypothetical protein